MKFSEPKSKAMITRKRKRDKINIFLNNRRLEQVDVMKYLGIWAWDNKMKFSEPKSKAMITRKRK